MTEQNKKVVTRFAPSPTGFMHVGNLRTGLFAWLWARKNNGTFILRIEDTDKKREVEGSIEHIKESLRWVGMNWDQGPDIGGPYAPYIQSERLETYKLYAKKLIDADFAYADPYTEEELAEFRKKADEEKKPFLYREHRPENPPVWDSTKPLRFKVKDIKRYTWSDAVWGELSAGPEALDDFILIKSDGYPTYNFAHLVDDIEMGVTHVMRGQEFISSTPKYLSVYEALGVNHPIFATTPPVMSDEGKKKLGKRDGAKDVLEYKKDGYLPEAMMNFLALLGWNPGGEKEVFTKEELIEMFDLSRIQHSGGQFGDEKLDWLNKEHMKHLSPDKRDAEILNVLKSNPETSKYSLIDDSKLISKISPVIFDHISKWGDINTMIAEGELSYYFEIPVYERENLAFKGKTSVEDIKKHLTWVKETFTSADSSNFESIESIKALVFDYATEVGRGDVLWPLRMSLSGKEKSPDPFTLVYILGKAETLTRIDNALQKLS